MLFPSRILKRLVPGDEAVKPILKRLVPGDEAVKPISILDPLDVGVRIDELKQLRAGWLDGKGVPPNHNGLDWLAASLDRHYPDDLSLPYLFPTPEGLVLAEWSLGSNSLSLEIDLAAKSGVWHTLNLDTNAEETKTIRLDDPDGWKLFANALRSLGGVNA